MFISNFSVKIIHISNPFQLLPKCYFDCLISIMSTKVPQNQYYYNEDQSGQTLRLPVWLNLLHSKALRLKLSTNKCLPYMRKTKPTKYPSNKGLSNSGLLKKYLLSPQRIVSIRYRFRLAILVVEQANALRVMNYVA